MEIEMKNVLMSLKTWCSAVLVAAAALYGLHRLAPAQAQNQPSTAAAAATVASTRGLPDFTDLVADFLGCPFPINPNDPIGHRALRNPKSSSVALAQDSS
jgi:hypothetical protein